MAETFVNVTEGSGKKLHAWDRSISGNTVLDEVHVQGEPYLASYVLNTTSSVATASSHLIQIMAGSTLKVRVRRIEIWQLVAATTAAFMTLQLLRLSSAGTGGGSVPAMPLDPADSAAGLTGMSLPTVKGTETGANNIAAASMWLVGATTATEGPGVVWDFDRPRSKPLIIAAGATNGICLKNTAHAGASVMINVWCDESNF